MCVGVCVGVCVRRGEAYLRVDDVWCLMIVMIEISLQYLCIEYTNAIAKVRTGAYRQQRQDICVCMQWVIDVVSEVTVCVGVLYCPTDQ